MSISLAIADDHPVLLKGLSEIFNANEEFHVVATCKDGLEALEAVRLYHPDIALLDIRMPKLSGLQVARQIREERLPSRVVLLAAALEEDETLEALRVDVRGILLKGVEVDVILDCMRTVHSGEQWVDHRSAIQALERMLRRDQGTRELGSLLTPREMQIVLMVTRGLRNKEVASNLCVSEGTVKVHLHNIYDKLNVDGRMALLKHAQQIGLV